jgi:hypothetical protein
VIKVIKTECAGRGKMGNEYKNIAYKVKKNWQVTYIAPLQPPALATFLSWGIQQELAV